VKWPLHFPLVSEFSNVCEQVFPEAWEYFVSIYKSVIELEGVEVFVFGIFALETSQLDESSKSSVPLY